MANAIEAKMVAKKTRGVGRAMRAWWGVGLAVVAVGCGQAGEPVEVDERTAALGESTPAYYWSGQGSEAMPDYAERVLGHVWNLARRDPGAAGVMGPLPALPAVIDPYFVEMARWQGAHVLESSCACDVEDEDQRGRSCCELGMVDGELSCVGEVVACDAAEGTTAQEERWSYFGLAGGVPAAEVSVVSESAEPTPAAALETVALGALSVDPGILSEQHQVMGPAVVRRGEQNYVGWVGGMSARALPVIADGVHLIFGQNADSPFGTTPEGQVSFSMLYTEPNAPPAEASVVFEDGCEAMTLPSAADWAERSEENPFAGGQARLDVELEPGCHRYVFAAIDGFGVGHTYPSYGSLGAEIGEDGQVLANSEACPVWSAERPSMACLQPAQSCSEGDERVCYSGREATREGAACQAGVERCTGGWWSGECDGESTPDATERCTDLSGEPGDEGDGSGGDAGGAPDDDEGCGCSSAGAGGNFSALLMLGFAALVMRVRRRLASAS
ncbi:hypothetical protein FRC98_10880 [Lujinxingia vulgaris]|uniref:Uncharacterized protein n=1 Tax=Lujinxingia vulgaris TaxID=2600176 RepID=A0A5C6XA04_9DELT|nr:MYXO-CTERM sorting domain-containing protein [Lujinxingia vulgaris]TXD37226.1 hypothetical protein FRC98_10880 [Lujinxingia vulgaris]